jgi:hypothetical protein
MGNEPTYIDGGDTATRKQIYYHTGLDIGGAEALTPVVAATDGLIVSLGDPQLKEHTAAVIEPRYDVIYLLDERGWYYRYSHLHSFDPSLKLGQRVRQGQRLGLLGKEGGSGGWSHLHFEPFMKYPNGQWGSLDGFAFLVQAYQAEFPAPLLAVARPHQLVKTGQTVTLTARALTPQSNPEANPAAKTVTRTYSKPGTYSELLEIAGADGHAARDSAIVHVVDAADPEAPYPSLHVAYYPSLDLRAGQPITFLARSFLMNYKPIPKGEEHWDFGDGSTGVTRSDGNAVKLAENGYGRIEHTYSKAGRYVVKVESTAPDGLTATMYVDVTVNP